MADLTVPRLMRIMPDAGLEVASAFMGPLSRAMTKWGIDTPARAAAFLAQAAHESGQLRHLEENLNYSATALCAQWPKRFTPELAAMCARNPVMIANQVYANRMGNGAPETGDGWLYRGRGIFQLTGRQRYRDCSIAIAGDADTLLLNPDLVASPAYACESAGWYWHDTGLSRLADAGDFVSITKRINGGLDGLEKREAFWARAIAALAD